MHEATFSALLDSLAFLNSHLKLDQLLPTLLDIVLELTGADRAFLMLCKENGKLSVREARNRERKSLGEQDFKGSTTIVHKALREKQPLYIRCIGENKEFFTESVALLNLKSAICLPLWKHASSSHARKDLLGLLYMDSSFLVHPLEAEHLQLVEVLVNHAAISIENASLFQQLEEKTIQVQQKNLEISTLNNRLQERLEMQEGNLSEMKLLFEESQRELGRLHGLGNLIGKSKPMREVFSILEKVVRTDATLLITGESGTGKELVARYAHHNGSRAKKPMVSINCSAFSDTLLENELFGHRKGAYTGATEHKIGLFEIADGGTLFLDEVGDMSAEMQKKLLRVLENGEVRPVGSKEVFRTDVRIIAATNKNLEEMMHHGKFREDLYFRLNVIHIHLPPLRERREDIPLLIDFFASKISEELRIPPRKIPQDIFNAFLTCDWPGNVRQLSNELRRVFILDSKYQVHGLQKSVPQKSEKTDALAWNSVEKNVLIKALEITAGNKSKAASLLGIPRRTLYDRLKKYNMLPKKIKDP
jgi:transcriptional regulator with GAF, ATPase, and Fis domain